MIAFYRGISPVSRAIRWRTWSPFSHVSWIVDPNRTYDPTGKGVSEIESWRRGVTETPGIGAGHTPGTPIDLYDVDQLGDVGRGQVAAWLRGELGKRYDFRAIFGFVIRWDRAQRADRWFCSELLFSACEAVGYPLLSRIAAHRVDPGMLNISPRLRFVRTVYSQGPSKDGLPAEFAANAHSDALAPARGVVNGLAFSVPIWLAIALLGAGGCGAPKVRTPATPGWPVFDGWTATNWPTQIEESP